jgi:hypothetical protein
MSAQSEQLEIRLLVDKKYLEKLQKRMGTTKATDRTRAALTLLDWATVEAEQGRLVLSSDQAGGDVRQLAMPELSRVEVV